MMDGAVVKIAQEPAPDRAQGQPTTPR
jgi:hypothetical protein